jgi:nucleotide-binding universal stress UspA family protein
MTVVVVAVDGSDLSVDAARAGLALLAPDTPVLVVTVVEETDPTLVTGSGMAGGVMSPEELREIDDARAAEARADVDAAGKALQRPGAEALLVHGAPGPAICALAAERDASAIVMGSRGRGGFKRALLGSVSDYVVRNAPCPVIITRPSE